MCEVLYVRNNVRKKVPIYMFGCSFNFLLKLRRLTIADIGLLVDLHYSAIL